MISLDNINLQRSGRVLLHESSLTIHAGQHIGICGANGSGKTSLFKLLLGELSVDSGTLKIPSRARLYHMAQEVEYRNIAAVEYVIDGDQTLRRTEQALAIAEENQDHNSIGQLHETLHTIDGYNAHYRAEQLLHGLGFSQEDCGRPVQSFSGGWRIRLNLAQVLMSPGDIILLDEPNNHLDLDATIWLEQWLKRFQGTLLLISHDRDFLDTVVQHIVHIEHKELNLYRGNYSAFERQRSESLAQQQALYEKQQQRIKEINSFVNRFRAKATKARQAQSRLKELDRMQEIAAAHVDSPFYFHIPEAPKLSDPLISMSDAGIAYGEEVILEKLDFSLHPGSCIGLLGANGVGKSSLIKALIGEKALHCGDRVTGEHLRIGYFAQHQLEALDLDASPLLHLQRLTPRATEKEIRNYLGGFNFQGERALEAVRPFSGGEKARLALAIVSWQKPNLLLMDEPTNHLDLEMRHALTVALQAYKGAMVIVSHDRHLLRNCVDQFWLLADHTLRPFDGDLSDYQKLLSSPEQKNVSIKAEKRAKPDAKERRQQTAEKRAQLSPLRTKLKKLEKEIKIRQTALQAIEEQLAGNEIYLQENKLQLQELLREQGGVKQNLFDKEEQWLACQEQLDTLQSDG